MWGARDVAGNGIGDSGGEKAEALTVNTTLTHLGLGRENGWRDACVGGKGDAGMWVWGGHGDGGMVYGRRYV